MMAMAKQSKPWVESLLVAYVDKQLEPAQMAAVEEIIRKTRKPARSPPWLRRSAAAVKSAYDQPLREPVPARPLATVGLGGSYDGRRRGAPARSQAPAGARDNHGAGGITGGARDWLWRWLLAGYTQRRHSPSWGVC
jgi:anti-sigma factor RsiW